MPTMTHYVGITGTLLVLLYIFMAKTSLEKDVGNIQRYILSQHAAGQSRNPPPQGRRGRETGKYPPPVEFQQGDPTQAPPREYSTMSEEAQQAARERSADSAQSKTRPDRNGQTHDHNNDSRRETVRDDMNSDDPFSTDFFDQPILGPH